MLIPERDQSAIMSPIPANPLGLLTRNLDFRFDLDSSGAVFEHDFRAKMFVLLEKVLCSFSVLSKRATLPVFSKVVLY